MTNRDSLRHSVTTAYGARTKRPRHGVGRTRPGSNRKIDPFESDPVATPHHNSALHAPALSAAYPMAKPGYGKRSAPDQQARNRHDFALLPTRERYVAGFVDHLPDGAAMSVKTLAKQLPLYGQQAISTALTALSVAGHLRRVRCPVVGAGDETRWVFRTFWSRTARDNEWWNTYLATEQAAQAAAPAQEASVRDTAPPPPPPTPEGPGAERPRTEQATEPTPVPHQRTPDRAPDTGTRTARHGHRAPRLRSLRVSRLPRPRPPRPRRPPPHPLRRRLRNPRTTSSGVARPGRERRLPDQCADGGAPRQGRLPRRPPPPPPQRQGAAPAAHGRKPLARRPGPRPPPPGGMHGLRPPRTPASPPRRPLPPLPRKPLSGRRDPAPNPAEIADVKAHMSNLRDLLKPV